MYPWKLRWLGYDWLDLRLDCAFGVRREDAKAEAMSFPKDLFALSPARQRTCGIRGDHRETVDVGRKARQELLVQGSIRQIPPPRRGLVLSHEQEILLGLRPCVAKIAHTKADR